MKINEAVQLLQNEINWCLDHPDPELNHDQRMGFVNGLKQAQYLLRAPGLARSRNFPAIARHCEHGYNGLCPACDATNTPPVRD